MFDTHCHLNFSVFANNYKNIIDNALAEGIKNIVVPGTDYQSSKKAVEIAEQYDVVYAAVGIHPHHAFELKNTDETLKIEEFLSHPKVVAVGEIGLDRHMYKKTKYTSYQIDEDFLKLQKRLLLRQIQLAVRYKKSIIFHNREAKEDLLGILNTKYDILNSIPIVFHCCEPDSEILEFAKEHHIYIGVDGDVTYDESKQEFVKKIPLELLVIETDSPFLKPAGTKFPNEPKNLKITAEYIAKFTSTSVNRVIELTTENAKRLFQLEKKE